MHNTRGVFIFGCLLGSVSVMAQTDVPTVLYGVVDSGFKHEYIEGKGITKGIGSGLAGQSRWGLRAGENLKDGLRAFVNLEGGFALNTGMSTQGGRIFGRQAIVGLAGDFGEVRLGRQNVFGYDWTPAVASPFGVGWSRNGVGTTFGYKRGDFGVDGRISNAAVYISPLWKRVQAGLGYSFAADQSKGATTNAQDRVTTLGLRYQQEALQVAASYERLNPSNADVIPRRKAQNLQLGIAYAFKAAKLHAGYNEMRKINVSPAPGYVAKGHDRDRAYVLGVSVPAGKGRIMGSYQNAELSKISAYALAYEYPLSKRTRLYAFLNHSNTRNHQLNMDVGQRQVAAGMQHRF